MLKKEYKGITWLEFEKLQDFKQIRHAIFCRQGGVSCGPYLGLNLSDTVGDNPLHVNQNRHKAFLALSHPTPLVTAHQVHGARVQAVYKAVDEKAPNCDSLITNTNKLTLAIQHADCQAAIFFDPVSNAIGCVHSGWKGNCLNIYKNTIDKMHEEFGSKASNLIVCISPSLGPEKAEFIHYKTEFPEPFWRFQTKNNYFNLWELARWQLETEGVLPQNIELAKLCTYSNADTFYSYRRDKLCGRNLTTVWLESDEGQAK